MDRADFSHFPFQSYDPRLSTFQADHGYEAAANVGPYMGLLTAHRGDVDVNFYGSQIDISDESRTSSPSTSTAPATQRKKAYETLTRGEETYLVNLWVEYCDCQESKDCRKYWDLIVRELNEKFGKNRTVDKCQRKIKYLVDKYKEKKVWNRKQSRGSLWKSPYYDELDAVLGTRNVVTFQHVVQTGSPSAESSSANTSNPDNSRSSAEESPISKERNSVGSNAENVAAEKPESRKQLRRETLRKIKSTASC